MKGKSCMSIEFEQVGLKDCSVLRDAKVSSVASATPKLPTKLAARAN